MVDFTSTSRALSSAKEYIIESVSFFRDGSEERVSRLINDCETSFHCDPALPFETKLEGILKSILSLMEELTKVTMITGQTFSLFRRYRVVEEKLMFFDRDFRDHVLHSFNNFLIGCVILNKFKFPIASYFLFLESTLEDIKRDVNERLHRTFRSWLLASFFHDTGYVVERMRNLSAILDNEFFEWLRPLRITEIMLDDKDAEKEVFSFVDIVSKVFIKDEYSYLKYKSLTKEEQIKIQSIRTKFLSLYADRGHPILSAFFLHQITQLELAQARVSHSSEIKALYRELMDGADEAMRMQRMRKFSSMGQISKMKTDPPDEIKEYTEKIKDLFEKASPKSHEDFRTEVEEDVDIALHAISLHRTNIVMKQLQGKIDFFSHAIAFLLPLCDEIQQWDRFKHDGEAGGFYFVQCIPFVADGAQGNENAREKEHDWKGIEQVLGKDMKDKYRNLEAQNELLVVFQFRIFDKAIEKETVKRFKELISHLAGGPDIIIVNIMDATVPTGVIAYQKKDDIEYKIVSL